MEKGQKKPVQQKQSWISLEFPKSKMKASLRMEALNSASLLYTATTINLKQCLQGFAYKYAGSGCQIQQQQPQMDFTEQFNSKQDSLEKVGIDRMKQMKLVQDYSEFKGLRQQVAEQLQKEVLLKQSIQSQRRKAVIELARASMLADESENEAEETKMRLEEPVHPLEEQKVKKQKGSKIRKAFANKLILYDYMLKVPDSLPTDWYKLPRLNPKYRLVYGIPEGHKCIISAHSKKTIIREKNGYIIKKINSLLPNGNKHSKEKGKTLVQGIYYERQNIIYLTDVIMWNDELMVDSVAEFRLFFLFGKILETRTIGTHLSEYNEILFRFPNVYACTKEGLEKVYYGNTDMPHLHMTNPATAFGFDNTGNPYLKDGIGLIKKEGELNFGYSADYLQWKDKWVTPYFEELLKSPFKAVVRYSQENKLQTQDGYELECIGAGMMKIGELYEISYEGVEMVGKQQARLIGIKMIREVTNKVLASTMSQILYKCLAKEGFLPFEELRHKAEIQEEKQGKMMAQLQSSIYNKHFQKNTQFMQYNTQQREYYQSNARNNRIKLSLIIII
eukprot:TRINITY_DN1303_c0_g1_i2.p1 TRINITY_DN1303_c0_g1~~TRINITY_DN1303_c0_g1_i2.p1  ORF type:complete len:561 (-),score=71.67 TRINITY_DN1303_c0_g1_i2:5190-6872(-)